VRRILIILVLVSLSAFLVLGCGGSSSSSHKDNITDGGEDNDTVSTYFVKNTIKGVEIVKDSNSHVAIYNANNFGDLIGHTWADGKNYTISSKSLWIDGDLSEELFNILMNNDIDEYTLYKIVTANDRV
jgi:hypothetical protein